MNFIENIKNRAKKNIKSIVLPEASDIRVLTAAGMVRDEGFAKIILVGSEDNIRNLAFENNISLDNIEIIDPISFTDTQLIVNCFYTIRKHKGISFEEAEKIITEDYVYFGNMLVKLGYADGLVSGAIHSSADTLRPALQIIKTAPDTKIVSSFFLMDVPDCEYGENGVFVYSDCGMIQNPTSDELVEIANSSAKTFELLTEKEAKVAFLSHSTMNTSKCDDVYKVQYAVKAFKENYPNVKADGELQFDAAIIPSVAKMKAPKSEIAGYANVLIFPDLDAGNIAYKITERLAHAKAYGPITQGIMKPVNDLSRGCNASDIVGVIAITCVQCIK